MEAQQGFFLSEATWQVAKRALPKHWEILRRNPGLRRLMIEKYYGELHRGKKIPDSKRKKIEEEFEKKFEQAKSVDPDKIYESQAEHDRQVAKFIDDHRDEIDVDRRANAVLYVYHNLSEQDKVKKYNATVALFKYSNEDEIKKLPANEEERKKSINDLKEANKDLINYIMGYDLEKLEFKEISDIAPRFEEINHYLQILKEMQNLPTLLFRLGILDDEGYLDMQARVDFAISYSWLFECCVSAHSSVLNALVDPEDVVKVRKARDWIEFEDGESEESAKEEE